MIVPLGYHWITSRLTNASVPSVRSACTLQTWSQVSSKVLSMDASSGVDTCTIITCSGSTRAKSSTWSANSCSVTEPGQVVSCSLSDCICQWYCHHPTMWIDLHIRWMTKLEINPSNPYKRGFKYWSIGSISRSWQVILGLLLTIVQQIGNVTSLSIRIGCIVSAEIKRLVYRKLVFFRKAVARRRGCSDWCTMCI